MRHNGKRDELSGDVVKVPRERLSDEDREYLKDVHGDSGTPKVLESFDGRVIGIADGDTLTVRTEKQNIKLRLEGIDAPELGQEHGSKAKSALSRMVTGKVVTVEKTGTDKYRRTLAIVHVDGTNVNEELVRRGWAWHFTKYNSDKRLAALEVEARHERVGLWAHDKPMAPWDYRDLPKVAVAEPEKKEVTEPAKTVGKLGGMAPSTQAARSKPRSEEEQQPKVVARYWLNTKSNKRHNEGCRWFGDTKHGRYCSKDEGSACGICRGWSQSQHDWDACADEDSDEERGLLKLRHPPPSSSAAS